MRRKYEFGIGAGRRPKSQYITKVEPEATKAEAFQPNNEWSQHSADQFVIQHSQDQVINAAPVAPILLHKPQPPPAAAAPTPAPAPAQSAPAPEPILRLNTNNLMDMDVDIKEEFSPKEDFQPKPIVITNYHKMIPEIRETPIQHSNFPNILRRARNSDVSSNGVSNINICKTKSKCYVGV